MSAFPNSQFGDFFFSKNEKEFLSGDSFHQEFEVFKEEIVSNKIFNLINEFILNGTFLPDIFFLLECFLTFFVWLKLCDIIKPWL